MSLGSFLFFMEAPPVWPPLAPAEFDEEDTFDDGDDGDEDDEDDDDDDEAEDDAVANMDCAD